MSSGNSKRRVVITGIAGRLGRLLATRLHKAGGYQVIGLDRRPFDDRPADIIHHQIDIRSNKAQAVFRSGDIDALIHVGVMHTPRVGASEAYSWNIEGTSRLLDYVHRFEVPKTIVLSSANVYGPRPENTQLLTEEAPLLAASSFPGMRDLVEIDHLASSFFWKAREIDTVILRPVHILGGVRNAPSNYLRLKAVPVLLGFDPMVQMIHELDLVDAIALALKPGVRGIYNVTGAGELPLSVVLEELGRTIVPVPHSVAKPLWKLAFRLGMSTFPVEEFDFIRYVCMVDGTRAETALGFHPQHSLQDTIHAVDTEQHQ